MNHATKLKLAAILQAMLGLGKSKDYTIDAMVEVSGIDKHIVNDFVYNPEYIEEHQELFDQVNAVASVILG